MEIKRVGVVGCGQMGGGITQVSAIAGFNVVVSEINEELLKKGLETIKKNLGRDVEKGKLSEDEMKQILARIEGTVLLEDFKDCDLVIEVILEKIEEKRKLFSVLDVICPPQTIFASNTSSLPIIDIAMTTKRPERFIGLHFFNPVPMMQLVEVVQTILSANEVVETSKEFAKSIGKVPVLVKDAPAFLVNRLLTPYLLDAIRVYEQGLASKEDIDNGMKYGANHPIGPLALADLIGLDTLFFAGNVLFEEFKEPRFAPPTLLKRMHKAGMYGRKNGRGFYSY